MSLYVAVLRGDYDALLTWPFSHRVTFTLLDQCQDPAGEVNVLFFLKKERHTVCKVVISSA